uniref:MarR family transcriptional regulator n=1 Tax=Neobacillus citreus TaxID=2833578 RepID=A0A942SZX0_9BACI
MEQTREQVVETLLVSVNRLIRTALQSTGSPTSAAVWRTLGILETDQPLRLGELARASRVAQPTMTRLVAGMLDDGLVARSVDPDDSRGQLIEITDTGRARLAEWRAALTHTVGPLFAGLSEDDWDALERAAQIVAERTTTSATRTETTA